MKACSRTPAWTVLFIVAASSILVPECEARTWMDVVDPSIRESSSLDVYRMEFYLEEDPFAFPTAAPTWDPSEPTEPEDDASNDADGVSSSPSVSPTARYDNVNGNGGCSIGEYLYELRMYDSWGDGWDDSVIKITQMATEEATQDDLSEFEDSNEDNSTITLSQMIEMHGDSQETIFTPAVNIFEGGLETGREGYSYLCLSPFKCYTVDIDGGLWGEEIKWEIRAVPLGFTREERENMAGLPVAKGLAPTNCQFSIPDEVTGDRQCPFICDKETASPSSAPSRDLSSAPSPRGSTLPSDAPSIVPSATPLVPSSSPSVIPAISIVSAIPASANPVPSAQQSSLPSLLPSDAPSLVPSGAPSPGQ
jgi:hypothetical protein